MVKEVERDFRFADMEVRRYWQIISPAGEVMLNGALRSSCEMV